MKIWATIQKDLKILLRDKVGLSLMFGMPVLLVIVVTSIQNKSFDLFGKTKISLLVCNQDGGPLSISFIKALHGAGLFNLIDISKDESIEKFKEDIRSAGAVVGTVIPANFSRQIASKAKIVSGKALHSFGLEADSAAAEQDSLSSLILYFAPVVQSSLRLSVQGALRSAAQIVETRQVLNNIYFSINEKPIPDSLENQMLSSGLSIREVPLSKSGDMTVLNATQHNVPAWTIFAMFFVVMSLGGSIVREKLSGSFIRLRTLPTHYGVAILSKQITYLAVTVLQTAVIFGIGVWLFPRIGLPGLSLPKDFFGLVLVTLVCGWCAVSYAVCVGVFARTQEQGNGFGAVSVVILSILGGIMVPSFVMPDSFRTVMAISPLHWCLEAYYGLFLEGGKLRDILPNILSLLAVILILQLIAFAGLKRKKLI